MQMNKSHIISGYEQFFQKMRSKVINQFNSISHWKDKESKIAVFSRFYL
jgi:hypothetical protein